MQQEGFLKEKNALCERMVKSFILFILFTVIPIFQFFLHSYWKFSAHQHLS